MPLRALVILLFAMVVPLQGLTIGKISFTGAAGISETELQNSSGLQVGMEYDPTAVAEASSGLYGYLNSLGLYFYHIPAPELVPLPDARVELVFKLRELIPAPRVLVRMQGMQYFSEDKLRQLLLSSATHTYNLDQLPRLMQELISLYHSRGYLFAKVQLDSLILSPEGVAYLGITEGKPMRVKEYLVRGNKITREKTLLNLSGLTSAKIITPQVLTQAEENILRKSYIRDCVVQPLDDSSLLIRVEEGRMTFLEGVLGMNSVNSELQLSGQLRLNFLNLWGSDRAIRLFWKQIPSANKELSLSYHDSGFPGLPFAADLEIYRSEQDSTWIKSKAALDIYYQMLRQKLGIALGAENIRPGYRTPALIERVNTNSIGAFWDYTRLEGGSNPIRGMQWQLRYSLINGTEAGNFSGSVEAGTMLYFPLATRWIGHMGVQIRNLDNAQAKSWEQFKMGGYGSLRGYREDEFSSFRLAWSNFELRYLLNTDSRIYLFFDQGFMGKSENSLKSDIFGLGGGLKIRTKLGILGIEYGLGYRDKRFARIGLGMVHAGLDLAL